MYRPIYHFLPEENWMNDPNGLCWYQGMYHLFYQYNPTGDEWGNIHWGHAVSKDCIHWHTIPIALYPSHELGEIHCFSGCADVTEEFPMIYYTSIGLPKDGRDCQHGAEQWCAVSYDGMMTWEKHKSNPILKKEDHHNITVSEWRDPFVRKESDGWYMVLGAVVEEKGSVLLYRSKDRIHWEYLKILWQSDNKAEKVWECPNYFRLGDKDVLVVSPNSMPRYWYGKADANHEFIPQGEGIIDHSGWEGFYAPNSFEDGIGRRIMIGWLTENGRGSLEIPGWKGVHSLPRVLTMEEDGLHMNPLPQINSLRGEWEEYKNLMLNGVWTAQLRGKALEIQVTFFKKNVGTCLKIQVFTSPDKTERTSISWERETDRIWIDREYSNHSGKTSKKKLHCPAVTMKNGMVALDIFLDYSTLEVFVSGKEVISTRVYPEGEDSDRVCLCASDSKVEKVTVYKMNSIAKDL